MQVRHGRPHVVVHVRRVEANPFIYEVLDHVADQARLGEAEEIHLRGGAERQGL